MKADIKVKIPDFLLEMSKQMHEQDNRITAEPIWQVRYRKNLLTADGYSDNFELVDRENDYDTVYSNDENSLANKDYALEYLLEHYEDWCLNWARYEVENEDDDLTKYFKNNFDVDDSWELPDDVEKHYLQEIEVVVKSCLTEADAKWFIWRKQHDYPKLYTYVESMIYCPQMIELRHWLLSLTEEKSEDE